MCAYSYVFVTTYLKVTEQNIAFIAPEGGCFQSQNGSIPLLWLEVLVLLFFLCRVKAEVSCLSSFCDMLCKS